MADRSYVNNVLTDREELVDQFGYHWTRYMKPEYFIANSIPVLIAIGIVFGVISIYPDKLVGASFLAGGIWLAAQWFIWTYITADVRIVTNKRVILKEGFFNRKTQEIKLSAIEAIEFEQNFIERLFRVGCLEITGRGGGTNIFFHHVSRPVLTKHMIENIEWEDGSFNPSRSG